MSRLQPMLCPCGCKKVIVTPLFRCQCSSLSQAEADVVIERYNAYEEPVDPAVDLEWENDADWIKRIVPMHTTPLQVLKLISANSMYLGTDPYYRDLNDALLDQVERVLKAHDPGASG